MKIAHHALDLIATVEAARICRAYPDFRVSFEDLQQEAWAVLLELAARFDPERGIPFGAYATLSLRYALTRYAYKVEHVTHVTDYAIRHNPDAAHLGGTRANEDFGPAPEPSPEVQVEGMQIARVLVRAIDRAIIGAPHGAAAVCVILGQEAAGDVAAAEALPCAAVYRAAANTRRRLRKDRALRRLYQEVTA